MSNVTIKLLANNGYIIVNKILIQKLGLLEAVLLGELASEYSYWENQGKLVNNEYFPSSVENIKRNTSIKPELQTSILNKLKQLKIIDFKKLGMPATRHIKFIEDELDNLINNKSKSSSDLENTVTGENGSQVTVNSQSLENSGINNNNIINKNNNKNNNKESTNIDSCAQPTVEHEVEKSTIKKSCGTKKSLLPTSDDLEEIKTKTKKPTQIKSKEILEDKKQFKQNAFLKKALEIVVTQLNLVDEEKIALIKDWLEVCYNKGVKTSDSRFKHIVDDLDKLIKEYSWDKASQIIHSSIVSGYTNLDFSIQNSKKATYNKAHTKAESYKFPGIKKDETVEEYLERKNETPEQHTKRMAEFNEKVKRGEYKTF